MFTDEQFWENQRRFSVKTLKHLGMGRITMIDHVEHEATELIKHLEMIGENSSEIYIQKDNSNVFDLSVMNVTWKILRGTRFELNDPKLIELMEMIHRSFQIIDMSGGVLSQMPWLRYIAPNMTGYRPLIATLKPLWEFLKQTINEVQKSYDQSSEPSNFIEFYCREIVKEEGNDSFFTSDQLLALCIDFFQAGSETTSNTLSFGILYMLHYPRVMKKVQNELDIIIGNRIPVMKDRPNLIYTEATINEIQRMANVAPLGKILLLNFYYYLKNNKYLQGIAHRAKASITVGDYVIPKDACVLFNLYSVHMDESYWKDAFKFEPERFLSKNGEKLINHEHFMPFGIYFKLRYFGLKFRF